MLLQYLQYVGQGAHVEIFIVKFYGPH
jgi:hypothetical protein